MRSDRYAVSPAQVELTWDETDHDRITTLSKNFNKDELLNMDFQAYLASSSEDEEDEVEAEGERSRSRPSYLNNHHTVNVGGGGVGGLHREAESPSSSVWCQTQEVGVA